MDSVKATLYVLWPILWLVDAVPPVEPKKSLDITMTPSAITTTIDKITRYSIVPCAEEPTVSCERKSKNLFELLKLITYIFHTNYQIQVDTYERGETSI